MQIESGSGFNLSTALMRETRAASPVETVDSVVADVLAGHKVRENLMAGSFVDRDATPSRYIEATMIGLKVESQFKNKMNAIVESYKLQAEATDSYAERNMIGKKAADAVKDMVDGEVAETEAERMEKEREEDEKKVEEKIEDKVSEENGITEETGGADKTGATGEAGKADEGEAATPAAQLADSLEAAQEQGAATAETTAPEAGLDIVV